MKTTDKVQTGDTVKGTSTTTSGNYYTIPPHYQSEKGWECPRCGRINAPWVRQCDCSRNDKWDITWTTDDYCTKPWWYDYKVTCNGTSVQTQIDSDTFKIHPESTVFQVGGSDYKVGDTYVNVGGAQSNKINPNSITTDWNNITTKTIHTGKTNYKE